MTRDINWNDPEARARLVEEVGVDAYNEMHARHRKASIVEVVNGHAIRTIGYLYLVGSTGRAHGTLDGARSMARSAAPGKDA